MVRPVVSSCAPTWCGFFGLFWVVVKKTSMSLLSDDSLTLVVENLGSFALEKLEGRLLENFFLPVIDFALCSIFCVTLIFSHFVGLEVSVENEDGDSEIFFVIQ